MRIRDVSVVNRQELGPDTQVDRKAMLLVPGPGLSADPFLVLAEDWFGPAGFDWHPHRGIETITFVVEGALEHRDNAGGRGTLGPGDVQWMTAGRGIIHRELAVDRHFVHTLQLWLNLPSSSKMSKPGYQDLRAADMPVITREGASLRLYSGTHHDERGPASNLVPTTFFDATLAPGARLVHPTPDDHWGFAYILDGSGTFGPGKTAGAGQVVHLSPAGEPGESQLLAVAGEAGLRFLFWSAQPIREPVVSRGPFVMNTEAEIRQAWADYHAGRFGSVPRI